MSYDHKDEVQDSIRSILAGSGYVKTGQNTYQRVEPKVEPMKPKKVSFWSRLFKRMRGR